MRSKRYPLSYTVYGFCILLTLALLLSACDTSSNGPGTTQHPQSTPTPSAQQLIKNAQAAIQKVTSYHFNLQVSHPSTSGTLPIQNADGDIVVPDKLEANATVLLNGATVQTQIIAIGGAEYINVLGQWEKTTGLLDPRALSDPQTGVSEILGKIQNPTTPTTSSSSGIPCWSINGKLDATALSGLTGGGAPQGTVDDVTTCIGKSDNLPYLIVIKGISAQGDTVQTIRTFKLSNFNERITITAPQVAP